MARQNENRISRIAVRQATLGIIVGMAGAVLLKGYVPLPVSAVHAAVTSGTIGEAVDHLREGRYRVVMQCRMKNQRVGYNVRADHAGSAHMALEWLMPACKLSAIGGGDVDGDGQRWYQGEFVCQSNTFRKTQTVAAASLREAQQRARSTAGGCRIETIDQTACPALDPLCERQSEDLRVEAELEQHRLLR